MALDVGDRTIGVAISDTLHIAAHPVETIRRTRISADLARIGTLLRTHEVIEIVVGLPQTLGGKIGIQAQKVQGFVDQLTPTVSVPITLWDERLSTVAAERALIQSGLTRKRRKKVIDQVAAVFFLQGYLDLRAHKRTRPSSPEPGPGPA